MKIEKISSFVNNKNNSQPIKPQGAQALNKKDEFVKQSGNDINASYKKEQEEKAKIIEQKRLEELEKFQEFIKKPSKFQKGDK